MVALARERAKRISEWWSSGFCESIKTGGHVTGWPPGVMLDLRSSGPPSAGFVKCIIAEIAEQVEELVATGKRPDLGGLSLSESTVTRRTKSKRFVPPAFGQFVEALGTREHRERATEVVEAGLRVLRGQPR